ncbi:MAG: fatty acid desaturase [Gemmatimonadota bacterium]|nr:fatty acid desaturase [Gemmatimonadota bacterium]
MARSLYQLGNTLVPYLALWGLMYLSLVVGYWLTLLLAIPTGFFLVRLFVLQHDCGHGSFFKSNKINDTVGFFLGVLTLMPYAYWRKTHAIHHATSGDLDRRGFGDIATLTVREYLSLSPQRRLAYRFYRNPLVLLLIGPLYQFVIKHRFPADIPWSWKREWQSVHLTNLVLAGVVLFMWQTIGLKAFLAVQLPITMFSGAVGVFLFYMQHQYEDTYWRFHESWNYYEAGLKGSSHYRLPRIFQWLTANIGIHHIHHVCSRIPNYNLQRCMNENALLQDVTTLTFWQSIKTLFNSLWDEDTHRLIGFRQVKQVKNRLLESGEWVGELDERRARAVPPAYR